MSICLFSFQSNVCLNWKSNNSSYCVLPSIFIGAPPPHLSTVLTLICHWKWICFQFLLSLVPLTLPIDMPKFLLPKHFCNSSNFRFSNKLFFLDKHRIKMWNGLMETAMPGLIAGTCKPDWLLWGDIKRRRTSTYGMDEFLIVVCIHDDFQHKNICLTFEEDSTKPDAKVKLRWVCFSGRWWVVRLQ